MHEFSVLFSYVELSPEFCIYLSDTLNMLMDRQLEHSENCSFLGCDTMQFNRCVLTWQSATSTFRWKSKNCREKLWIWGRGDQNLGSEQHNRDQWSLKGCHIPQDYLLCPPLQKPQIGHTQFKACSWVKIT